MKSNTFVIFATIAASVIATAASAQTVTPQDVLNLPVGTKYVTPAGKAGQFTRTANGFKYAENTKSLDCNNVTKAGGKGNATINCKHSSGEEYRFEWADINKVKMDTWDNLAAKTGNSGYKPPKFSVVLTRSVAPAAPIAKTAEQFADGSKVAIKAIGPQEGFTLIKQGQDKNGDGIYLIQSVHGPYLTAFKAEAGQMVGYTNGADRAKASKWILHKNSSGWSIIAANNGSLTVTKANNGIQLQFNRGAKDQVWAIEKK